jgi:hypothetical protein
MNIHAALTAGLCLLLASPPDEKLTPKTYERYKAAIDVKPAELVWQVTEWKKCYWDGLVESQAKDKPILFWIYEGDPRGGC